MTDFHYLYTKYANDIYHFALLLCGSVDDAKEITAETFARALTGKAPLVMSTVKGYLLAIARNLYLEILRRRKRVSDLPQEVQDFSQDMNQMIEHKTELEALQAFLNKFPEVDRAALLLRADGVPYDEITKTLNISLASAKVKVHRLRVKLLEWRANRELVLK